MRFRSPHSVAAVAACLVIACGSEQPAGPGGSADRPDPARIGVPLTIDVASGRVSVGASSATASPGGSASLSLMGSEAVAVHASNCTFTAIPNKPKQKRCVLDVALENRLAASDLVTPTTFPRLPQGVSSLVVFPYTAASLGVPGSGAVANALWDGAPINFFNDFGDCATTKSNDCYRWEAFPSPLGPGETTDARQVGFDVDKAAQSVTVYLVVAADVGDGPRSVTIHPELQGCGSVRFATGIFLYPGVLAAASGQSFSQVAVCGFVFPSEMQGKQIVRATLGFDQTSADPTFFANGNTIRAQHVVFGVPLTEETAASIEGIDGLGTLSDSPSPGRRTLDVTAAVRVDIDAGRVRSQYYLNGEGTAQEYSIAFAGPSGADTDPTLTIVYR